MQELPLCRIHFHQYQTIYMSCAEMTERWRPALSLENFVSLLLDKNLQICKTNPDWKAWVQATSYHMQHPKLVSLCNRSNNDTAYSPDWSDHRWQTHHWYQVRNRHSSLSIFQETAASIVYTNKTIQWSNWQWEHCWLYRSYTYL